MKCSSEIWNNALRQKSFFASEFLKYHGPTDSQAGKFIVEYARNLNLTERTRPIPGKTLRSWLMDDFPVPLWAAKAMLVFILNNGFVPDTDKLLNSIVVLLADDCSSFDDLYKMECLKNIEIEFIETAINEIWHAKF